MTAQFPAETFTNARIVPAPAAPARGQYGRVFDLPPALFWLTVGAYMTYLAVMAVAFRDPQIAIPMVICVISFAAGFGVPALWAGTAPTPAGRKQSWGQFMANGFECATGHVTGGAATAQVLILPGLILLWGVCIAIIAAAVR
ncbi:hypothetical protein C1T17_19655 [Sphingobium sp. SCG-1]|uniref:hypothetical protein n=1 Tax=Sphingobium sp. SCG-1 TaxID=2072936 RepID=UPI000CD689C7|nr:hypothetical protein [Sphingobium sp. SCG-1]AUW56709.1 hypothetical protein C1T17_00045 [Sphingobium sp. SCG-1]AUW59958.1 hypothetical protein C1T17_19655 [Sphingobium sp. SCG-1]